MLAKFEYMMWVMHGMFGIVKMLFHNHNIQATSPTVYSVQNLSIILQAVHIYYAGLWTKPFSAVPKKATIGPQMKLPVDSFTD